MQAAKKVVAGGVDALHTFRAASEFFCEKWPEDTEPSKWEGVKLEGGKVTVLKVTGTYSARNRLPSLPAEVAQLSELKVIELAWCKRLSTLPPELGTLSKLTALGLPGCQQVEKLPPAIGQLESLLTLDLSQCRGLIRLPPEIGECSNLTTLACPDCTELVELPAEVGKLVNLSKLVLTGCENLTFPPKEMHRLPIDDILGFRALRRGVCARTLFVACRLSLSPPAHCARRCVHARHPRAAARSHRCGRLRRPCGMSCVRAPPVAAHLFVKPNAAIDDAASWMYSKPKAVAVRAALVGP